MRAAVLAAAFALALYAGSAAVAAPGGGSKPADPGAAAVIVDANGKVVGPVVSLPNDSYVYYGEIGAAYRVGTEVARVGFVTSPGWTFGVLTRVYRAALAYFTTSNCTGQAYVNPGLPGDYKPYAPVFVMPPISLSGNLVTPARVMRQTTQTQTITALSRTDDAANCVVINAWTGDFYVVDLIGDFPFVAPFSIR